ncbi:hypothetical protein [Gordonia aichiensis]
MPPSTCWQCRAAVRAACPAAALASRAAGAWCSARVGSRAASSATVSARHSALSLGDIIADHLPEAEAGRGQDIRLDEPGDDQFDRSYGRSLVQHYDDDAAVQTQTFQQARLDRDGFIDIEQGWSRFGPRGILRLRLGWRDLTDDGRYVIVPGTPPVAVGADRRRVVSLINSQIAEVVRAIRDDRA